MLVLLGGPVTAEVVTIIPTYRRPGLAKHAVQSALAQRAADHRVVVVDDGGGQVPIIADPRVTVVSLSRNLGAAGVVRNVGIRISRSRYLAFLDDDNRWTLEHLEVALAAQRRRQGLVYTGVRRWREDGTLLDELGQPFDRALLKDRAFVDTSAIVAVRRRGVRFSRVPRDRWTVPGEDWEFIHRLSRRMHTRYLPVTTVEYLAHDASYYTEWS